MDLGMLMGGGAENNLNDDLAAITPSGESIFKTAFGDQTGWKTDSGTVTVSFMFDPKETYTHTHNLASITSDYMSAIRKGLTKHLLEPEDIAPTVESIEEMQWNAIITRVPARTLSDRIFADQAKLDDYLAQISKSVCASDDEEKKLTQAMTASEFKYHYAIAIDAYPDTKAIADEKKRKGVLHFYIEGSKTPGSGAANTAGDSDDMIDDEGDDNDISNSAGQGYEGKMKELEARLSLNDKKWIGPEYHRYKHYPETASLFFTDFGGWFRTQLETRAKRLELSTSGAHNMYQ